MGHTHANFISTCCEVCTYVYTYVDKHVLCRGHESGYLVFASYDWY